MLYFGIPRHTQSIIAYRILSISGSLLHCGNNVYMPHYNKYIPNLFKSRLTSKLALFSAAAVFISIILCDGYLKINSLFLITRIHVFANIQAPF